MNKIPDSELETIYNRFKNRKVTKDTLTSIGRDYKVSHVAIKNAIERYENQLKHKKVSNESLKVTKNQKAPSKKTKKSTLELEKELEFYKYDLRYNFKYYDIIKKVKSYQQACKNKSIIVSKRLIETIDYPEEDIRRALILLENKKSFKKKKSLRELRKY